MCADLSDPETRERETRALAEALAETGATRARIITLYEQGELGVDGHRVRIVPAWAFGLGYGD